MDMCNIPTFFLQIFCYTYTYNFNSTTSLKWLDLSAYKTYLNCWSLNVGDYWGWMIFLLEWDETGLKNDSWVSHIFIIIRLFVADDNCFRKYLWNR